MSQLKVNTIRHTAASSDAVTLASDGTCTAKITNNLSNRRLTLNGDMSVAQRGDATGLQSGYGGADRYLISGNTDARVTLNKTTGPALQGFPSCQEVDVTTADSSLAAGDYTYLGYRFEGQDLQQLKKGTANAESVTLSFWVSSPKTGTHIIQLYDNDNARHISKSYTVNTADTWEKKTLTFAGDTTGAFGNDNGYSLQIYWWLAAGSNYTDGTLATSWQAWNDGDAAVGQVNCLDNTANNFKLTGVQLEVGDVATDFEHRSYGDELARCQRYYELCANGRYGNIAGGGNLKIYTPFKTIKRASPTVTLIDSQENCVSSVTVGNFPGGINSQVYGANIIGTNVGITGDNKYVDGLFSADSEL